jgi:2-polyprenyl-6-methoxyphenol hydroxylase-like FAD-dependent oxidoreductase
MPDKTDVLIAGAGPTGLALALWLARAGLRPRIIERDLDPPTTSRAIAVQARTLELYRQLGFADEALARGRTLTALNFWVRAEKAAHLPFGDIGKGRSPYPFMLMLAQDEHERLLVTELKRAGVVVERGVELTDFEIRGDSVCARLQTHDGRTELCEAAFLAGCDGARSAVRHGMGAEFPGGTYGHLFYVADLEAAGPGADGELHVALDDAGFLAAFPLPGEGHVRLIGTVRVAATHVDAPPDSPDHQAFTWNDVDKAALARVGLTVRGVKWFSTYRVHHRVVESFRKGPVFLLGDAAHLHSPVGGQGMNTGIGDAFNLAWKLADVLQGRARPSLLDTYETERRGFALRLVATTDRVFTVVTREGALARWVRTSAIPEVLPRVFETARGRAFLFATVSQTRVRYRSSALSEGSAGRVHAGDRLPWVADARGPAGDDNFASLGTRAWQAHVYGARAPGFDEVRAVCARRGIETVSFPSGPATAAAGLEPGAVYLVRPDGYLAFVDAEARGDRLEAYLTRHCEA